MRIPIQSVTAGLHDGRSESRLRPTLLDRQSPPPRPVLTRVDLLVA